MPKLRTLLLAACAAALPLAAAVAAQPARQGVVVYDVMGNPIGVLTPLPGSRMSPAIPAQPEQMAQDPALRLLREIEASTPAFPDFGALFAQQQAMMREVMSRMDAFAPDAPSGMPAFVADAPGTATRIIVSSFSSGRGSCTETISYDDSGAGGQPHVTTRRVGDACAPGASPGLRSIPASQPDAAPTLPATQQVSPEQAAPPAAFGTGKLYRVKARVPAHPAMHAYSG